MDVLNKDKTPLKNLTLRTENAKCTKKNTSKILIGIGTNFLGRNKAHKNHFGHYIWVTGKQWILITSFFGVITMPYFKRPPSSTTQEIYATENASMMLRPPCHCGKVIPQLWGPQVLTEILPKSLTKPLKRYLPTKESIVFQHHHFW